MVDLPDDWPGIQHVKLIDLISRITLIDTITTISTLAAITNIENVESIDLIDEITRISQIGSIAAAATRDNLFSNPGFETGDFQGWLVDENPTIIDSDVFEGTYSCSLSPGDFIQQELPDISGKHLSVFYAVKFADLGSYIKVTIYYTDDSTDTYQPGTYGVWYLEKVPLDATKFVETIRFEGAADNEGEVLLDYVSAIKIPYALRDSSQRAITLPVAQYLATPPTLSDEDYHHMTLTSDAKVRTYDPAIDAKVDIIDTVVDAIKAVTDSLPDSGALSDLATILTAIQHGTYGLSALETLVDEVETYLKHATYGLSAIEAKIKKYAWKKQPITTLNQDPPVQNTWYDVLGITSDGKIILNAIKQVNDETDDKTVEVRWIIDGETYDADETIPNNTWYYPYLQPTRDSLLVTTTMVLAAYYAPLEGQSIRVRMRMTSAPGTNQELDGRVHYETWEET